MDAAKLYDISVAFAAATPAWPGDTPFSCGWAWDMSKGASVNVSQWVTSPHVGTHADAPLHVLADGAGADALPLLPFVGAATVVDVAHFGGAISLDGLRAAGWRPGIERLVLRTQRTTASGTFPAFWPSLDPAAATALVQGGLRLLAVDCPSVDDRESKDLSVHHAIFGGGAYVLENLDLRGIEPGDYELVAFPLKVDCCDAAPVRAFIRRLAP
jgi:arylformamidase